MNDEGLAVSGKNGKQESGRRRGVEWKNMDDDFERGRAREARENGELSIGTSSWGSERNVSRDVVCLSVCRYVLKDLSVGWEGIKSGE